MPAVYFDAKAVGKGRVRSAGIRDVHVLAFAGDQAWFNPVRPFPDVDGGHVNRGQPAVAPASGLSAPGAVAYSFITVGCSEVRPRSRSNRLDRPRLFRRWSKLMFFEAR